MGRAHPLPLACIALAMLGVRVQAATRISAGNIKTAVKTWVADEPRAQKTYGHIRTWDVTPVPSMRYR